ncbi:MAG: ABC transporter ATP-binding protein [Sebaldella sp.]|nr:ABC transporter ATP-binding protein [Sebaldella sp.]
MNIIEFKNVSKSYSDKLIIKDLSLQIAEGEFITIVGTSGNGKTTLLKMINSLEKKTSGKINILGKQIEEWNESELRKKIGYVVQSIGLFPHLTIEENIGYVLSLQNKTKNEINNKAKELLNLLNLSLDFLEKYPRELSGGEQQRVGFARALASDPKIILMDEPFGALDEINRKNLQNQIKNLQKDFNLTIVLVTHDIEEAFELGTRIVVMNNGNIEQIGTKEDYFNKFESPFVKDFLSDKLKSIYINDHKISLEQLQEII